MNIFLNKPFALLLFLVCMVQLSKAQNFDINTLKELNLHRNIQLDGPMKAISSTEAYIGLGLPIGICIEGIVAKNSITFKKGLTMSLALAASTATTYIIKHVVNRPRPAVTYTYLQPLANETNYSFPSGHTSNAFCTATSLSLQFRKWYVIAPSFIWAGAVGYSRMHMGVHYPSDVLGGALVGAASAWATFKANKMIHNYYTQKKFKKESE